MSSSLFPNSASVAIDANVLSDFAKSGAAEIVPHIYERGFVSPRVSFLCNHIAYPPFATLANLFDRVRDSKDKYNPFSTLGSWEIVLANCKVINKFYGLSVKTPEGMVEYTEYDIALALLFHTLYDNTNLIMGWLSDESENKPAIDCQIQGITTLNMNDKERVYATKNLEDPVNPLYYQKPAFLKKLFFAVYKIRKALADENPELFELEGVADSNAQKFLFYIVRVMVAMDLNAFMKKIHPEDQNPELFIGMYCEIYANRIALPVIGYTDRNPYTEAYQKLLRSMPPSLGYRFVDIEDKRALSSVVLNPENVNALKRLRCG